MTARGRTVTSARRIADMAREGLNPGTTSDRSRPLLDIGDFPIKGPVHFTHRSLATFNARISGLRERSFPRTLAVWPPSGSFLPTPPRAIDPKPSVALFTSSGRSA